MHDQGAEGPGGLRARLLGHVELAVGGREIPANAWPRRNSRYLLLLLLCSPGHRMSRDMAMESLWPNASLESATRALYVAIHGLRRVLEPEITAGRASRFVDLSGEIVQLVPGSLEWLDVEAFEAALDEGGDRRENLSRALSLYAGDLLEDEPYLDWPAARREQLRWRWREAVLEYAELERQAGRPMLAVPPIERILEGDPGDELAYRALMMAYADGQRGEDARRVFERCVASLESELGVSPSQETVSLWESIQARPVNRTVVAPSTRLARLDNLPRPSNPLVGRARDTEELLDLVCDPDVELVTISGTGGLGKTRVGLEVASLAKDEFEHGVCFVSLAHIRDASLVVPALVQALGLDQDPDRSPLEQARDRLREASMLLVLDNFEQVLEAAADVAAILESCPGVTMLVTSRAPLRIRAEHEFPLEPLAVPNVDRPISLGRMERYPSVELFAQRASAVRRSFSLTPENAEVIARICARLDGVPLAIELAAARIRDLQPQELIDGLEDRFDLLTGGFRDMPPRHQTMWAAISWSYDLLDVGARELFRRLGVFEGGFEVDAAAQVAGELEGVTGRSQVAKTLAELEEQGLLESDDEQGSRRYWMFETIREFARRELEQSGDHHAVAGRHADWFVEFVMTASDALAGPDQNAWFERIDSELPNIRAAAAFLEATRPGSADGLRLTAGIWRFWWKVGRVEEGLGLIERAMEAAEDPTTVAFAQSCNAAGHLAEALGRYDRAESLLQESLRVSRTHNDLRGMGDALDGLAIVARHRGDLDTSQGLLEEALELHRQIGNDRGIASALNGLGAVGYYRGDAGMARTCWTEATGIIRKLGGEDRSLIAVIGNLAALENQLGHIERAMQLSREALVLARRVGDSDGITHLLVSLGTSHLQAGELDSASTYLHEALAQGRESGLLQHQAITLFNLGEISLKRNDVPEALNYLKESLAIFAQTRNIIGIAGCLEEFGGVVLTFGEADLALRCLAVGDAMRQAKGLARETMVGGQDDFQVNMTALRERLGEEDFEERWECAVKLDPDAVVQELLAYVPD